MPDQRMTSLSSSPVDFSVVGTRRKSRAGMRAAAWLSIALAGGSACAPVAPGSVGGGGLSRIRATGVLRWGGDQQGGEPYVFADPARPDTLIGFEVEIAAALAAHLGARAQFVQNDWSTLIPSLERGTFDVALNGIEVTPALQARVLFSRPYFVFAERLVGRRGDARVTGLPSVRGLRVGTLASTQAWHTLLAAGAQTVPYEGVDEPLIDLESGRTDAVLLDDVIVDRYLPRHPTLRAVGDVGVGRYAVALRSDDGDLRAAIDDGLDALARSGQLRRILRRWNLDGDRQAQVTSAGLLAAPDVPTAPAASSPRRFGWPHALLFLRGALFTLLISTGAMALAIPLGLALALARLYRPRLRRLASAYVELFRGTPVLLQLYVIYYGMAPFLRLNAPAAAVLGLGLNYAAYEAEIDRAAISAIAPGQMEAALSLGMTRTTALRRVILPQALRVALPGATNDFIALLKDSSLVSVISVVELTKRMSITAVDTRGWLVPGLVCAALYFAMSYPLSRLARRLEARRGDR